MTKSTRVAALSLGTAACAVLVAIALLSHAPSALAVDGDPDGDGRGQVASFVPYSNDPLFHSFLVLDTTVTTAASGDKTVELIVKDTAQVVLLDDTMNYTAPVPPLAAYPAETRGRLRVDNYPQGSVFTIVARYFDSSGGLVDEESLIVTRP